MSAVYNFLDCDVKGFAIAGKIDVAVGGLALDDKFYHWTEAGRFVILYYDTYLTRAEPQTRADRVGRYLPCQRRNCLGVKHSVVPAHYILNNLGRGHGLAVRAVGH